MSNGIRKAAFQAPQPRPATPINDDPTPRLEAMYQRIWTSSMREMSFVNLALSVEAIGFRRWPPANTDTALLNCDASSRLIGDLARRAPGVSGDWVGAVITPWFINLFVLPGGGDLWSDRPSGERCNIAFPIGPLQFIADDDATGEVPSFQYCPLFAPPAQFTSQAAARAAAMAALNAMFTAPVATASKAPAQPTAPPIPGRRTFLRRVVARP
ncbi:[NiFe]-hydrogenase assembly chaperone HybE [Accumulibacter sp.]|uniref:[NiFe]-hydrogenase assembly chaperone HybE n=1 Tax=Accumulibacter sp. TaxID=2053492 RepID=UPI0028C38A42|nr:[NiFe]-hydrogenase assembly chaperone HybE [Accumulibacter sp.]